MQCKVIHPQLMMAGRIKSSLIIKYNFIHIWQKERLFTFVWRTNNGLRLMVKGSGLINRITIKTI